MKKVIPYGRQQITEEDIQAVNEVLVHDFLTTGPKVNEFEEKFADYVGSKYAVAVSNGTAALHLSALALGVNQHSRVITTPITFAATANCIKYCGGQIEFCDIDPDTLTLDIDKVRERLKKFPKGTYQGIIPVDFAGYPVDLEAFRTLADEYDLWIIEDACHAPGGWFKDKNGVKQYCGNGNFADLAVFSFHPVKHIACGEGGMITTNSEELYKRLKRLRSHGMVYQNEKELLFENHGGWYMEMQELGFNYRIPDILCALGISQLKRQENGLERRKEIARTYDSAFRFANVENHEPSENFNHSYHLYVIQVDNRKELYLELKANRIYAQVHYVPLHLMPFYKEHNSAKGRLNIAEQYYERCISLPMYPSLSDKEQDFVIKKVLENLNN